MEKAEKEKKERDEQQRAIEEEVILSEKEQLRLELERMEEGKVTSEASEGKNDETQIKDHVLEMEQQGTEETRQNNLTEVTVADYV